MNILNNKLQGEPSIGRQILNKVPEITLLFWIELKNSLISKE